MVMLRSGFFGHLLKGYARNGNLGLTEMGGLPIARHIYPICMIIMEIPPSPAPPPPGGGGGGESAKDKRFAEILKYRPANVYPTRERDTKYTGWPRNNATTLIVNFKNIINKTELILFHYVEN